MKNLGGESIKTLETSLLAKIDIDSIISTCQEQNFAFAIYQQPWNEDKEIHFIIDLGSGINIDNPDIDEMGSGFIFHPFSPEHHQIKFIQRDIHLIQSSSTGDIKLNHSSISSERFTELFENNKVPLPDQEKTKPKVEIGDSTAGQKEKYISLTQKTIGKIKDDSFKKAVLARSRKINLPNQFNSFNLFELLAAQYSNAFVYLVSIPGIDLWVGATPETLINISKDKIFKTSALAATQASNTNIDLEDTTWSQKDIEEQAMVSRYIINCFKKIRLREFEEVGPRTHFSGNLVHLKTDYVVDMEQVAFPQLGTVMLQLLHPTSAVCGMPKEPSMEFLMENEGFDREYFTGYLGPVNVMDETSIYVNLRCMKIMEEEARLFAGAGIISNSNPEKEWLETEIKMETILEVLRKLY